MNFKLIPLTQGKFAKVSLEDYDYLSQFKWYYSKPAKEGLGYAKRDVKINGIKTRIYLHREILHATKKDVVDHINLDKLDCRRENLRKCTQQQNNFNLIAKKTSKTGYRGISWNKNAKLWVATIWKNSKMVYCKYFKQLEEAVSARNEAIIQFHGEFANIQRYRKVGI